MRVLHVSSGNLYGGIETFLVTLARYQASAPGLHQEFALFFEGRLSRELRAAGALVHVLGGARASRPWTITRARRALRALLKERTFEVAVVHGSWPHAMLAPVLRRQGLPIVLYAHGPAGMHWTDLWSRLTPPTLVLANSRSTASSVTRHFPQVRCRTLHCAVDLAPRPDAAATRAAVRLALGTPLEAGVIIQSSRMESWKGHELHLAALAQLRDVDGWECWMAGGAQTPGELGYVQSLRAKATALGIEQRIRFLGQRDDIPQLLQASDIHCQPNQGPEPFGIAYIEALWAGLPVVTTAMGGALEIVDDTCGILVPPEVPALAAALRRLLVDPVARARLAAGGPVRAQALCDPVARLRDLVRVLTELSGEGFGSE